MKTSRLSSTSNFIRGDLNHVLKTDAAVYFILTLVALMSYGYELFNFHLTIDEEMRASQAGMWFDWIAQGRWGMALSNYIFISNPVVPAASIFIGVLGLVSGIAYILKSTFNLDRMGLTAVTALAITIPTLPFSLTFSTIAYGIGVGFIALAVANWLLLRSDWTSLVIASLLAGFAIGIYQTFVFVIAMIAVACVWHPCAINDANFFASIKKPALFVFGGVVVYWVINMMTLNALNMDIKYVGQFIDIRGFVQDPVTRFAVSFQRLAEIINLSPTKFGISSVWLRSVAFASIVLAIAYPLFKWNFRTLSWIITIVFSMASIAVIADAIAQGGAPLRSVIYIPFGIAIIVACAYSVSGKAGKLVLLLLCGLTVIGNSQVNNHLFASSASAEFQDRVLAQAIINEVRRLDPGNTTGAPYKIEVIGSHSWSTNGVQSKTETFGASFFEWDGGNRHRVAAYLNLNGLASTGASDEERARAYVRGKAMPAWPNQGSITMSGDNLILKFGDYSMPQKIGLCALSLTELCEKP